jgi:hypothetical protein
MYCSGVDRPFPADTLRSTGTPGASRTEPVESFAELVLRATRPDGQATGTTGSSTPPGPAAGLALHDPHMVSLLRSPVASASLAAPASAPASAAGFGDTIEPDDPNAMAPGATSGESCDCATAAESVTPPAPRFDKLLAFWNALTPEIQASLLTLPVETQTELAGLVLSHGDNTAAFWNLLPGDIQAQFAALPHVLKAHLSHELGGPWLNLGDPSDTVAFGQWLGELFHAGKLGVDFFKVADIGSGTDSDRSRHESKGEHANRVA